MAGKEKRFIKVYSESMGENQIIVDSLTGVNYLFHNGGGLTVLLDADGKPVVSSIKE